MHLCRLEGVPARTVQLQRVTAAQSDSHVVAEVYLDGEWVLIDPTFDLRYEIAGKQLTALDMRDWVLENPFTRPEVTIVHGSSADAPKISDYYINPYLLYNIVTFKHPAEAGPWDGVGARIPFVRRWARPRLMSPHQGAEVPFTATNLVALVLDIWATVVLLAGTVLVVLTTAYFRARRRNSFERTDLTPAPKGENI